MKIINILCLAALVGILSGCLPEPTTQGEAPVPKRWKITIYSNTDQVKSWTTKDNYIRGNSNSDVFDFIDEATGKRILITGTIIIEEL